MPEEKKNPKIIRPREPSSVAREGTLSRRTPQSGSNNGNGAAERGDTEYMSQMDILRQFEPEDVQSLARDMQAVARHNRRQADQLKGNVADLENKVGVLEQEKAELQGQLNELNGQIDGLDNENIVLSGKLDEQTARANELDHELKAERADYQEALQTLDEWVAQDKRNQAGLEKLSAEKQKWQLRAEKAESDLARAVHGENVTTMITELKLHRIVLASTSAIFLLILFIIFIKRLIS